MLVSTVRPHAAGGPASMLFPGLATGRHSNLKIGPETPMRANCRYHPNQVNTHFPILPPEKSDSPHRARGPRIKRKSCRYRRAARADLRNLGRFPEQSGGFCRCGLGTAACAGGTPAAVAKRLMFNLSERMTLTTTWTKRLKYHRNQAFPIIQNSPFCQMPVLGGGAVAVLRFCLSVAAMPASRHCVALVAGAAPDI